MTVVGKYSFKTRNPASVLPDLNLLISSWFSAQRTVHLVPISYNCFHHGHNPEGDAHTMTVCRAPSLNADLGDHVHACRAHQAPRPACRGLSWPRSSLVRTLLFRDTATGLFLASVVYSCIRGVFTQ